MSRSRVRFPLGSLGFFVHNTSGRTVALGSNQPLVEVRTRNVSGKGGNVGRYVRVTTLLPTFTDCQIWQSQPPEALRACQGPHRDSFTLTGGVGTAL